MQTIDERISKAQEKLTQLQQKKRIELRKKHEEEKKKKSEKKLHSRRNGNKIFSSGLET